MKPVGVERDKQIAELRGYLNSKTSFEFTEEIHLQCDGENWHKKNWSTSWNDAKELWDELNVTAKEYVVYEGKHIISLYKGTDKPEDYKDWLPYEIFIGKDFPDAVSQAWLKWKERE